MKSILVIDDEVGLRDEICTILEFEGFATETADNGKNALEKLHANQPDLILCDIYMPEMNGFELLHELQQDTTYANIPFVFVSAVGTPENKQKGLQAGAKAFILKPFKVEELLDTIETFLS